ncbi:lysine--tRNA ligase [Simkania negevensis]|uniref:Lysine--tRNA ligase n=1 Tax=Simkania negevensis TaxID=83561 RepID=A0ABS3AQ72_9BACT|nr:lysine--tRNA ligase [Simkania negevensis]
MPNKPDYVDTEEYQNRLKKLNELRQLGIVPYPHHFEPKESAHALHNRYADDSVGTSEEASNKATPPVVVAGRLVLFRAMGKNAFAHIQDATGRIQLMFNRDHLHIEGYNPEDIAGEEPAPSPMKVIEKKVDFGDWLGIKGCLFRTKKGELTVYVHHVTLLCKSLLPLPEKHAGLVDKEMRYRKRWLDLIDHDEVRNTFRMRSEILRITRSFFEDEGFLEVETPVLQHIYGGANARPFTTHLHSLDQDMFCRISLEISLKKLIIGGMDKIFEIGKVFRNEGIDKNHNPEFTLLEAYAAYWDYNKLMSFTENLFEEIALTLFSTTKVKYGNPELDEELVEVDYKAPWPRLTMHQSIKKFADIDIDAMKREEMAAFLIEKEAGDPKFLKEASRGLLTALIFEETVEQHLLQPHHIIDHPIETTPLCKPHRNEKDREKGLVERFESYVMGHEICNAYTELNDPIIQRKLLEEQQERCEAGDEEANPLDEEFIEAICQGMPPTGGIGIGMDRVVMLFTNSHSIRDVLFFPLMKG